MSKENFVVSSLGVSSGVVIQASGWTPTGRTLFQEPLPQSLYGSGDVTPISSFTGTDSNKSINVNVSGGSITAVSNVSGQVVQISATSGLASGLNVIASVTTTIPAYQSGTLVGISGGQLALSGLNVVTTVNPFGLQSGTMVLISGGQLALSGLNVVTTVAPFGFNSGSQVGISGGQLALSGLIVEMSGEAVTTSVSGNAVTTSVSGNTITVLGHVVSGGVQVSGTVAISNTGFQVSGTVAVSGVVAIGSGSVNILSGAISIQSGIISISGGVQVSGTVAVSGIVQIGSGSINDLSGLVTLREWPSYTLTVSWSGPPPAGIIGLANAGGAAGQSGMVLEITRVDVGIWASGNINSLNLYRVNDTTVVMSGPAGTIIPYYSGNALSLASGFIVSSSGLVSGAYSGITPITTLFLEANSSGYVHNYSFDFNSWRMQNPQVVSGQGFMAVMLSGIGVGTASFDWIERYLS